MNKKVGMICVLCFFALFAASALDLYLTPYVQGGSGQASGSLLSGRGDFYAELGASSGTALGSSAPFYPILLLGAGVDLSLSQGKFFLWKGPLSFVAGLDAGEWGGAVSGSTAAGAAFASTRARSMAITLSADERISLNLGPGLFSFELGPFVGFNGGYLVQEAISGITSTTWLWPAFADIVFVGASLGFDYGFRLGPGRLRLGLRGDIGLTPLSSAAGALGAEIDYPWRAFARAGYDLPLGAKKAEK